MQSASTCIVSFEKFTYQLLSTKMVNCKFYETILYGTVLFHFGLITAIKIENERVWVECTPTDNGTFYPHPDCTKYYECASGLLFTRDCSPGTFFNSEKKECDFPYNVPECEGGTRPPDASSTSTTTGVTLTTASPISISTILTPTMTSAQTTTNTKNDSTTPLPNWCSTEGETKLQYPGSCISYFMCIDGVLHIKNCTYGLHFNPSTEKCDLPENVNCTVKITTIANSTEATEIILACPSNPTTYLPHPVKISQYYLCEYGVLQALFSCSNNYKFDFVLQTCKIPGDSES